MLEAARSADLFDARIDGSLAEMRRLPGKPAPDTYLAAAAAPGVAPARCAGFEDALAGVGAGRAGGFAWVVGIDRLGQAEALRSHDLAGKRGLFTSGFEELPFSLQPPRRSDSHNSRDTNFAVAYPVNDWLVWACVSACSRAGARCSVSGSALAMFAFA